MFLKTREKLNKTEGHSQFLISLIPSEQVQWSARADVIATYN